MTSFVQKKIGSIAYNHLNLPNKINLNNGASLSGWSGETRYIYRADGTKIKKENKKQQIVFGGTNTTTITTDYLDGFHYETTESTQTGGGNFPILTLSSAMEPEAFTPMLSSTSTTTPASSTVLKFIPTAEGFYDFEKNAYIYQYKDHLGNARVTYNKNMQIVDTNNYYPFGMNHLRDDAPSNFGQGSYKNYKYNGKELQETGMYDYGARFYMADIGRWGVHDPLSEKTLDPYGYVNGNPIRFIDPTGMEGEDWYEDEEGHIKWFDSKEVKVKDDTGKVWNHFSDGKTNNTYTAKNGAFVTLGSGGAGDWSADYTDVNRAELYSAIANCEVCQGIERFEQFLFVEVPLIAFTGGSGLAYYEAVALRGVTDMGMQYLFKKEIDYKQTAINAFVGAKGTFKGSLYNYGANMLNITGESAYKGTVEEKQATILSNAITGAFTVGIGRAYTKGYMKTIFIPSLYQEGTNSAVEKINK